MSSPRSGDGDASIAEIARRLDARPEVWYRAAATYQGGAWLVRAVEVTTCEPPTWRAINWRYPAARLLATKVAGWAVAKSLTSGDFFLEDIACQTVNLPDQAMADRRPSEDEYGMLAALEWPSDEYRLTISTSINSVPGPMVAADAPPFSSFDLALANTFGLSRFANWRAPQAEIVIREVDKRARILEAYVDTAYVDLTVDGEELDGLSATLAADIPGETKRLTAGSPQKIRFDTPEGMPPGAWLAITLDDALLDQRPIDLSRIRQPAPGVTYAAKPPSLAEDEPYTAEEQQRILAAIEQVKAILPANFPDIAAEQLAEFGESLDEVAEELPHQPRKRIDRLFLGSIADAVRKNLIPDVSVEVIVSLLKYGGAAALPTVTRIVLELAK